MRHKRKFDAKKAVKAFYAGKRKKLPKLVGTDKEAPTLNELKLAKRYDSNTN